MDIGARRVHRDRECPKRGRVVRVVKIGAKGRKCTKCSRVNVVRVRGY